MLAPWIKGDEIMQVIEIFNRAVMLLFLLCYSYQFFYLAASLLKKTKRAPETGAVPRLAILIAARNESCVIGSLLDSIAEQSYPAELLDVFVCADNCTDDTAAVARAHGAVLYDEQPTRFSQSWRQRLRWSWAKYCSAFTARCSCSAL